VIEPVVDQVIQTNVIITRHAHGARRTIAAAEYPGGKTHRDEGECEQDWRQLDHDADDSSVVLQRIARPPERLSFQAGSVIWFRMGVDLVADRPVRAVVHTFAQILARLEMR